MKRSELHQVIGCLFANGEEVLANEFATASLSLTKLPDAGVADDLQEIFHKELGRPEKSEYNLSWRTPNGGSIAITKTSNRTPKIVYCPKGKEWLDKNFPGLV